MIQIKLDSVDDLKRKKSYIWSMLVKFCESGGGILQLVADIRSILQNRKMWPMLQDFEDQAFFYGDKIPKENWKVLLLSAWRHDEKQEAPVIWPGLRKEPVLIFKSTSKSPYSSKALSKKDFCSFIEFLYAEGISEHNIKFTDKAMAAYETYTDALQ